MSTKMPTKIDSRPPNPMRSTWRFDKSQWGPIHWIFDKVYLYHWNVGQEVPVHQKTDKIPYMREYSTHAWIWMHALWPIAVQMVVQQYLGKPLGPVAAFTLYTIAMQLNAIHEIHILRRLGHKVGYLDGDKAPRDGVPDNAVWKTFTSLELTTTIRPMLAVFLSYKGSMTPTLSWWLPVELGLYSIILDGWFYGYHRSCHEVDGLWQYHRTHHLTKHPSPLLSSFADSEQEFLELALIPVLTWATLKMLGFPMGFHDWWLCHEYIIFAEAFGHSGVRIYSNNPGAATWFLKMIDCELQIEDHDLHHRQGWRSSANYGKATRFWDRMFGTVGKRIEATPANLDMENAFNMPLF